jgi:hypothetical protein
MKTRTKGGMIAIGLGAFVSASVAMPSVAAPLASSAAALRAAVSDDVTQVRRHSRRGWHRGYGFRSFGRAFGYSRGYGYGGSNSPAATGGGSLGYNRSLLDMGN